MINSGFFPTDLFQAKLIRRPNRFVVHVRLNGKECGASLPNPGKLGELFLPGAILYLQKMKGDVKYAYRVAGVERENGEVVMLDTHCNNKVARHLIESKAIPSLKGYHVVRAEVTMGHSRFDFLLADQNGENLYCEVKSCTLFGGKLAMFPDAVTARGKRHVEELMALAEQGIKTAVVFVLQSDQMEMFSPDYHTDPEFSETLYNAKDKVKIIPVTAGWDKNLNLKDNHRELPILWDLYTKEGRSGKGFYLMLFSVEKPLTDHIRERGYYLYVSSESENISKKLESYKRIKKSEKNTREILRNNSEYLSSWIIRSEILRMDDIDLELEKESERLICEEDSRLFFFSDDPRLSRVFQNSLITLRMEKPLEMFDS